MIDILDYQGQHVHMIGIGGSSMSGLAEMLLKEGYTVTGSDNANSHAVERLRNLGIDISVGHKAENVRGAKLLSEADVIIWAGSLVNPALLDYAKETGKLEM